MKKKRLYIFPLRGLAAVAVLAAASLLAASTSIFPISAFAQTLKPAVEDPFSWLEGPVQCNRIKTDFRSRYGVGDADSKALTPVLEEELRHLVGETCENTRYTQCAFSWCAGRQPKQVTKETETIQELDNAEAEILAALQETNRLVEKAKPEARVETPAKVDHTARAKLDLPVEEKTENKPIPAVEEPVAPAAIDLNKAAEERLSEIYREREASHRRLIESRAAGERSKGTLWLPIRVPGADRLPRVRAAIDTTQAAPRTNPIQGGAAAGNGMGRTITPGLSDTASADGPSYMINGTRQVPIADDDRQSYRRILENARSARNAVRSE